MSDKRKEIMCNAFYMASPSQSWGGMWANPEANGLDYLTLPFWTGLARLAERGLLDCIFLADSLGVPDVYQGRRDAMIRSGTMFPVADPMMVVPAMAAVAPNICFGITGNTSFEPPFLLARRLSTLDHLTSGRLAWNVVTGAVPNAAAALGLAPVPHDERYDRADEFMALVYKLWEGSWEDGAVVRDRATGIYADPARVHAIVHDSQHFKCEGVHLVEPSRQRTPLIFTAGASGRGQTFGGLHAECTFISANSIAVAKHLSSGFRAAALANGRRPEDLKVFAMATVIVAKTEDEAKAIAARYQSDLSVEGNIAMFSAMIGVDLSVLDPDEPIEAIGTEAIRSVAAQLKAGNDGKHVTPRDLARFGGFGAREAFIIGSPIQVCDTMMQWSEEAEIDGFNLVRTVEPAGLRSFVEMVVPELQRRGVYKTAYRSGTMRERLFSAGSHLPASHPAAKFRRNA